MNPDSRATQGVIAFAVAMLLMSLLVIVFEQFTADAATPSSHPARPAAEPGDTALAFLTALGTINSVADQHDALLSEQYSYPTDRALWQQIAQADPTIPDACADLGDDGEYAYNIVLWTLNRVARAYALPPQFGYDLWPHVEGCA